jgi:UDP-N-acetylmuramoyl-tripeptide--D-alanyl-D-alanine ligase
VPNRLRSGAVLIDDSYNANPGSVAAAIAALAQAGGEAWLVLGNMAELGEGAQALHADLGHQARGAGIARLWTIGDLAAHASRAFGDGGRHFTDQAALADALRAELRDGVRCLVKGSRSSAMDKVVKALLDGEGEGGHAA